MTQLYILKEVENIAKIAKNIFGDIISKVYYAEFSDNEENEAGRERAVKLFSLLESLSGNTENSISQDGRNIVIEFVNGRKVIFDNSEWGSMEKFSDDNIKSII